MAVKWYAKSIPEVEELQSTDAMRGVSRKSAALRLKRDGENCIFKLPDDSFKNSLLSVISGFSFILLFVAVAIYAFYDGKIASGIISIMYITFVAVASFGHTLAKNKIYTAAEKSLQKVRVIRGGREIYVDMRAIVRGDVILLRDGDIVPCDMYITEASDDLYVIEGRITGGRTPVRKMAGVIDARELALADRLNIVFASSIVRSGNLRGIAVEVGRSCEVVRLHGEVPLFDGGSPRLEYEIREFSSKMGLRLLCVGVLTIVLGFFHNDGGYGLFMNFFSAAALCACVASEIPDVIFNIVTAAEISRGNKTSARYLIKNEASIESIATINTLVVKSDILNSNSTYKAVAFAMVDEVLYTEAAMQTRSRGMKYLLECAAISSEYIIADYKDTKKEDQDNARYATGVFSSLISNFGEHRHYGALMSRPASDDFKFDTVVLQGSKSSFAVATGDAYEILEGCNRYIDNGQIIPIDSQTRSKIASFINSSRAQGLRVIAYARSDFDYKDLDSADGIHRRMQFIGCVSLGACASDDVVSFLDESRERGLRVITLHDGDPAELYALLRTIKGYENATVLDGKTLPQRGREIDPSMINYDIYIGLTPLQKERLVRSLSSMGRRVGVFADDFSDYRMMFASEVSFTGGTISDFSQSVKWEPSSRSGAVLREADAIVDRNVRAIGALIDASAGICKNSGEIIKYMSLMLALRCFLVIVGAVFGVKYITPAQIMYQSLVADSLSVVAVVFGTRIHHVGKEPPRVTFRYFEEVLENAGGVVSAAILSIITPIVFAIAKTPMSASEICGTAFLLSLAISLFNFISMIKPVWTKITLVSTVAVFAIPVILLLIPVFAYDFGTVLSIKVIASVAVALVISLIFDKVFKYKYKKNVLSRARKIKNQNKGDI